ncbi:MAG: hypothetical protein H6709_05020 [Kofleriaceae bacterium]|nr:hypothetical protein [Myxococcales bacterium]MCB9559822.1 hypothetical protein [Kofleriaceae bacterium]MCB9571433.1 hypothetical protein [Kofleriaceae bacterium]
MRTALLALLVLPASLIAACGDNDIPAPADTAPPAPVQNDPRFAIDGARHFYLVGNDLTPGQDELTIHVTAPAGTAYVDAWIDGNPGVRLDDDGAGGFALTADIGGLAAGDHAVLLAADSAPTAFARVPFVRTHPLYFMMTTDWDFSDPTAVSTDFMDQLHDDHPSLLITHFVGPYTFTDPAVSDAREAELVSWIKAQRDDHGDEIGLHIHPYCNFVEYAGLTCNIDDSTVYSTDATGYTVQVAAYGDADFRTLLETADQLFMERGLGKPITFRAGGWTASIETMRALAATGYVADTSANNWARMEEWDTPRGGTLYDWNMEHWASIGDTSQPYYPNQDDILADTAPTLDILEVPDNAIMVDYVSVDEMVEIFDENWDGVSGLTRPTSYMMGFHPSDRFTADEQDRVDGMVSHVEDYLAVDGNGPVVFALLRDMPQVWRR